MVRTIVIRPRHIDARPHDVDIRRFNNNALANREK